MEQKTIETVRQAELAAEQTEKTAASKRDNILAKAKADAKETVTRMTAEAKARAAETLKSAHIQSEKLQSEALETAKQEIAALHARAGGRQADAKRLILSQLI